MEKHIFTAQKNGKLGEALMKNYAFLSYNQVQKILRQKDVKVNGKRTAENIQLFTGDQIEFYCEETRITYFTTIFNDENILVVNKRFGIIVAKNDKTKDDELCLQELLEDEFACELFPYNRIDMNTSGIVVFAKTEKILKLLQTSEVTKYYIAEVVGNFNLPNGTYEASLEKTENRIFINEKNKIKKENKLEKNKLKNKNDNETQENIFEIKTEIKKLETREKTSLLEVVIKHGKTHQIRAHLAYLGFPIVGDNKYGNKQTNKFFATKKQKLIAYKIEINSPSNKLKYLKNNAIEIPNNIIKLFFK